MDASRLRVAFVGKGGAGKSVIAGTFARLLAARGEPVLVVDSDPLPGLAYSLGVPPLDTPIPDEAVVENADGERPRYRLAVPAAEAIRRYAATGPDGIRVLQFGKLRGSTGQLARSQAAFHAIIDGLPADDYHVVGDLPGGTRQPFFGWGRYAKVILVVVEPTAKSLLTARRLARLALAKRPPEAVVAVANKVREPDDVGLVARRSGLEVIAAVPWDYELAAAERRGRPPIDAASDSPAVMAVASLLERIGKERTA
ncbi:MAG: hypothetical protein M3415_01680 [Actinomycetota bacterium]|jgi:CO dehydrogenase maturation factor|nr:hypothetical protein [Actinomycetota bacterium]